MLDQMCDLTSNRMFHGMINGMHDQMFDRTSNRTLDGMFDGLFDGLFDGMRDQLFDWTSNAVFDGTFDGMFDRMIDGTVLRQSVECTCLYRHAARQGCSMSISTSINMSSLDTGGGWSVDVPVPIAFVLWQSTSTVRAGEGRHGR